MTQFRCVHQRGLEDKCALKEPNRPKFLTYGPKRPRHGDTHHSVIQRNARQKSRENRDDLAVPQDVVCRMERCAKSLMEEGHFTDFTYLFSSKRLARFPKFRDKTKGGLSQPWSEKIL